MFGLIKAIFGSSEDDSPTTGRKTTLSAEKRTCPRYFVEWEFDLIFGTKRFKAVSEDVSCKGISVLFEREIRHPGEFEVEFLIPPGFGPNSGKKIRVIGKIAHNSLYNSGKCKIGIHFVRYISGEEIFASALSSLHPGPF